ncbi:MAG: GntR family transcriptional regulator [Anaerolineae bacterium]|nr:GntR family transcriptional regulator [Anaerolineae bacterium]
MPMTSGEIKQSLIHKMLAGQYPVGSRLPSCRALSRTLGINRNTASKVYQELARDGFVKIVRGSGVIVTNRHGSGNTPPPGVHEHIMAAVREAKLLGMGRAEFLKSVIAVADSLYQQQHPAVAFVECNEEDVSSLAREVEAEVSLPIQPILLAALAGNPQAVISAYDIICTTLYHLAEVVQTVGQAQDKVVAVHAPPDPEALLDIARLEPGARIGIICEEPATQQYLTSAVGMVYPGEIRGCLMSDRAGLETLARAVDVVIDVPSCHQEVSRLFPSLPVLTVGFRIDSKSLGTLRERINEWRNEETRRILDVSADH